MNKDGHNEPDAPPRRPARRILGALVVGLVGFALLWMLVFSAATAALVATGLGVAAWGGGAAWDPLESVLEAMGEAIGAILAMIAAALAAIVSIFS